MAKSAIMSVRITGNADDAIKAFDRTTRKAAAFGSFMGNLGVKALSKVGDVIASSLDSAISRADQMNNFPKVMKNLGYSSEDAAASIRKISESLDGLPTTSSAMTGMVQQLAPLTSNLDEATNIALAFNNAMLAGGASTQEQENALTQYTQMLSAGKVDMQAWRSIQAAMPGQLNQVAEAMLGAGKNGNDLYEAMKDNKVSFDDFNKAVMNLNQNGFGQYASFAQQAKDATQGIGTAVENTKNRVAKAVQKVIEAVGVERIAGRINEFSAQFGKWGDAAATAVKGVIALVKDGNFTEEFARAFNVGEDSPVVDVLLTVRDTAIGVFDAIKSKAGAVKSGFDSLAGGVAAVLGPIVQFATDSLGLTNNLDAGRNSAQSFGDILQSVADMLRAAGQWLQENSQWLGSLVVSVGGAVAAYKAWQTAIAVWQTATKIATGVQAAFNVVMNANPIMLVITAIGALVAGLVWFFTQTETGRQAWQSFMDRLAPIWQQVQAAWTAVWNAISAFLTSTWNAISGVVQPVIAGIASFIQSNMDTIQAVWNAIWGAISAYIGGVWNHIQITVQTAIGIVQGIIKTVTSLIQGDWSGAWEGIKQIASSVWNGIGALIGNAINTVRNIITSVLSGIGAVWNAAWNGLTEVVGSTIGNVIRYVTNLPGRILSAIGNVGSLLFNAGKSIIDGFLNGLKSAWDNVTGWIGGIGDWIKEHKGPPAYDAIMLVNNGRLVMRGFARGMQTGFDTDVRRTIGNINGRLSNVVFNGGVAAGRQAAGAETVVNVTFNAPVDREGVAREIRKILRDYDRKRGN